MEGGVSRINSGHPFSDLSFGCRRGYARALITALALVVISAAASAAPHQADAAPFIKVPVHVDGGPGPDTIDVTFQVTGPAPENPNVLIGHFIVTASFALVPNGNCENPLGQPNVLQCPAKQFSQFIVNSGDGNDTLTLNDNREMRTIPAGDAIVDTGGGDDVLTTTGQINSATSGGTGDDKLVGAIYGDGLDGGPGDDQLVGGGYADKLVGGPGRDDLDGGASQDGFTATPGPIDWSAG